jgi:hypothetical protein
MGGAAMYAMVVLKTRNAKAMVATEIVRREKVLWEEIPDDLCSKNLITAFLLSTGCSGWLTQIHRK